MQKWRTKLGSPTYLSRAKDGREMPIKKKIVVIGWTLLGVYKFGISPTLGSPSSVS